MNTLVFLLALATAVYGFICLAGEFFTAFLRAYVHKATSFNLQGTMIWAFISTLLWTWYHYLSH